MAKKITALILSAVMVIALSGCKASIPMDWRDYEEADLEEDAYEGEEIDEEALDEDVNEAEEPEEDLPPFEGGAPAIPEDLTEEERELVEIVGNLNSFMRVFERDLLDNRRNSVEGIGVNWDYLMRYCMELGLSYEEALEKGLISDGYLDGFISNEVRESVKNERLTIMKVSEIRAIYDRLFSREAEGLYYTQDDWKGDFVFDNSGEEYFWVWGYGNDHTQVVFLLDWEYRGDELVMTFSTSDFYGFFEKDYLGDLGRAQLNYEDGFVKIGYYIEISAEPDERGVPQHEYEFYYYPDMLDFLSKSRLYFYKRGRGL